MMINTSCNKCGTTFQLELGELNRAEAERALKRFDVNGGQCPGQHMEMGGLWQMWNLEDALHRAYDLGEASTSNAVPSDKEHVESLQALGHEVLDGGSNAVPELNLPSIHTLNCLSHIGSGNFASATHLYLRCDSPRGTRFYTKQPR